MSSHAPDDRRDNQARVTLRARSPHSPTRSLTSARMSWYWRLEGPSGAGLEPAAGGGGGPRSGNQGAAGSWLGENWRDLLERGVATVTLFDGAQEVYGPMSLAAT